MNSMTYTLSFVYTGTDYGQLERTDLSREEFEVLFRVLEWMRKTDYGKIEVNVALDSDKSAKYFDIAPTERTRVRVALDK